jgi:hypothetical protein
VVSDALERDYVLRIARQIALFVARLLKLKEQGDLDAAQDLLLSAYGDMFGIDRRFVGYMRPEQLVQALGPERAALFAELMAEEAELRAMRGDAQTAALVAQQALLVVDAARSGNARLRSRLEVSARGGIVG